MNAESEFRLTIVLLQSEKEKRLFCVRYDVVPNKETV